MKPEKHYEKLMARAINRQLEGYSEVHHIIPKCLGGTDEPWNLVKLTAREHYVAHQLLLRIYPEHRGLSYAALLMTRSKGKGRIHNRLYSWVKNHYAKLQSEQMRNLLQKIGNPSTRAEVKEKRRAAWTGPKNPSWKNPNWHAIKRASLKTLGGSHREEHTKKIKQSITLWHKNNPDRHPMKNQETVKKAVLSRQETAQRKKIFYWGA